MSPVGDAGGEEDHSHVHSGGCSATHVPSGGWGRRGSVACMHCGMLSDMCPHWGMGEEKRIGAMYTVGERSLTHAPVWDGGGEEDVCQIRSGGCSVTHVPS